MDRELLTDRLEAEFGGTPAERRVVARMAGDLADARATDDDLGFELTPDAVVNQLADAPGGSPAERWNWWMGALEAAHGGYRRFRVTAWQREDS
ncbi:hypothetical protein [Halobacterium sp. R2-5]|uniref:hypothetical protein n=1 Tax=Halobacterium sp. R2-5 TaxID=2715751 RepID=UPI00141E0052|nr:hypothetical protein [Halobacterium sp. R2-5]NIB98323.1 hypothetical protein [Halobacterium sp. R2-5]